MAGDRIRPRAPTPPTALPSADARFREARASRDWSASSDPPTPELKGGGQTTSSLGYSFADIAIYPRERSPDRYVPLRAKLAVGAVDDPSEAEADRIADRVMATDATVAPPISASTLTPTTASPDFGSAEIRQRVPGSNAATVPVPAIVRSVVASAGAPLDADARAFMEPRFGRSFADVRVHIGPLPSQSAASIGARAYTVGSHIVFRAGAYAPTTPAGRHLLAHELAHVAQGVAEPPTLIRRKEQSEDEVHPEDADVSLGVLDTMAFGYVADEGASVEYRAEQCAHAQAV